MWRFFHHRARRFYERFFRPIPEDFHSFESGTLFASCHACDRDLLDGESYLVEKGIAGGEVIYEYAVCSHCLREVSDGISQESKRHLRRFRRGRRIRAGLDACAFCGLPRHDLLGFSLLGLCVEDRIFTWRSPLLVCESCGEELSAGLSAETRGELDRFEQRVLPDPPGLAEPLPIKRPTLLV